MISFRVIVNYENHIRDSMIDSAMSRLSGLNLLSPDSSHTVSSVMIPAQRLDMSLGLSALMFSMMVSASRAMKATCSVVNDGYMIFLLYPFHCTIIGAMKRIYGENCAKFIPHIVSIYCFAFKTHQNTVETVISLTAMCEYNSNSSKRYAPIFT